MSIAHLPLRAGVWKGNPIQTPILFTDAQYIYGGWSGRFFTFSSGLAVICGSTTQTIAGWAEWQTDDSTSSITAPSIVYDSATQFVLPCYTGTAYAASYVGSCVDLIVASNIQYAYLAQSTHDLLIVVGGHVGTGASDSYVIVQMNPNEFYRG